MDGIGGHEMKVLMATPFYDPIIGGTERFVADMSVKLNQLEIETDVLTFNIDENMKLVPKYDVLNHNGFNIFKIPALFVPKLMNAIDSNFIPRKLPMGTIKKYDLIHFHNDTDLSLPFFTYLIRKPKIFHFHCLNVTYQFFKRRFSSRNLLKSSVSVYIVASKYSADLLLNLGFPEGKIRILPNGLDVEKFSPNEKPKAENLLVFIGRIAPQKGLLTLLRSLKILKPRTKLLIIGPLAKHYIWYFNRVMETIKNINDCTHHEVRYLGVLDSNEVIQCYRNATIFVCPSIDEPFGIVNIEALACETPVVASNSGGIPEVIQHGINGWLVPPNSPQRLADALQYLLENECLRQKMGSLGRKYVVDNFSSDVIARKLCKIYGEIIQ